MELLTIFLILISLVAGLGIYFVIWSAIMLRRQGRIDTFFQKWENPFDEKVFLEAQEQWQAKFYERQKELNDGFLEVQKSAQDEMVKLQKDLNTKKVMTVDGYTLRQVKRNAVWCPEVEGQCKGSVCGHYRKDVNGVDICRALKLEFKE